MLPIFTDPNRSGLCLYLACLALVAMLAIGLGGPARSDTPAESRPTPTAIESRINAAIKHLVGRVKSPVGNPYVRQTYIRSVVDASNKHDVPPLLLVTIAYREGSFKNDSEGGLGERSTYQMHGVAAEGCDLRHYSGASDCAAKWLRKCYDRCESWQGAVSLYASGRVCRPDRDRLRRVVADRVALWQELEALGDATEI